MSAGMTEAAGQNSLLFYKQIEPLSSEQHAKLGIREIDNPYAFLSGTHLVPLTVDEFVAASVCYPIIFDTQSRIPLAVMGMRPGHNVFFGFDGRIDPEIYIPAFARRYPFITANAPPENGEQRSVVCIDRSAPMLSESPDTPFFTNGELSEFTKNAIEFCRQFEGLMLRTQEFVALCEQNSLFELTPINVQTNQTGEAQTQRIGEYLRVSDQKLKGLPKDVYLSLRDRGVDLVVYAHLISQQNWSRVVSRAAKLQSSVPLG
jgi:hypothetical protein